MASKYLDKTSLRGLEKVGNVLIPGNQHYPKFSHLRTLRNIDRIIGELPSADLTDLALFLKVLAWTPSLFIKALFWLITKKDLFPDFLAGPLRLMDIGLKGIIYTLYYSNTSQTENILKSMEYCAETPSYEGSPMQTNTAAMTPDEGNLESGSIDLDKIFEKAKNAGSQIGKLTIRERLAPLIELKELVLERQEELIDIIQKETNKSRSDALFSEIFPIVDTLHWMEVEAENILKDKKVKTPIVLMGKTSYIYHQGLGVVLVISPWNYPLFQALVPIAHALICGNAVIYKPSEFTPLKGAVESLLNDAGVSSDLVQVIYGGGKLGSDLIEKRPDKIFFTGSVGTGKKIMQQAGKHLIPVELELGGKDPMIVFEDANIQRSVKGAAWGAMTNAGQSCTSVERLYVHEDIYENFKSELIVEVGKIKQLIDTNGNSDIGHMTNSQQAKKVRALVLDAVAKGAKALTNEYWIESPKSELEIPAIVLEGVTSEMEIWDCEIFGPILPIFKFSSEIDVINRANDSSFGLSASVWTADKTRATRVTKSLETGNVSVNNVMLTEGNPYLPFGGVKNSGIGRYKGAHGLLSFCNIKSVLFDGNSSKVEANWYPYTTEKYHLFDNLMQALFKGGIMGLIKFAFYGLKLEMLSGKLGKKGRA